MAINLTDKIVLITGASSGIGKACAELFAKAGAKLILCARRIEKLDALATELHQTHNTETLTVQLDVSNKQQVFSTIENLTPEWQAIDIVINNAGLALSFDKFHNYDPSDWDSMIDTNIKGLLYVTRAIVPQMVARNQGHIINIGSIAGHEAYPNGSVYCATKHAVKALTQSLKMDLLGTKLRVSSVDPGLVETEFSKVRFKGDNERAENVYQGVTPLTPNDIAETVLFCATRPTHVNINDVIIMPVDQASATLVNRSND